MLFEKKLEVMRSELKASRAHAKKVEGALLRQSCAFEKKLEVNRSELRASRAQGKKLEAELVRTQKQTAIFKARLAAVYGSHSWRLTAPLRIVFELVRPALSAHWLKRGFPKKDPR
jgi:hypothetical protein